MYLVRLLFCMFADDTGIFQKKNQFLNYLVNRTHVDGSDLDGRLHKLFEVLDTPEEDRSSVLDEDLTSFPYINGKLFAEKLDTPSFTSEMRNILIDCCELDWSNISPAIFGSLFQSVMEPKERRIFGSHYTSEKNILKLIKPLFLDELWEEFHEVKNNPIKREKFHSKIANLKFLDPACGCGNFLIITYRELRILEIEVLKKIYEDDKGAQQSFDVKKLSWIDVDAFYGIEICEFPARIAEVAMWMMDHLMNNILNKKFGDYYVRLPLKKSANIVIGNALRVDWNSIIPKEELSYILGNPPFAGKNKQTTEQKKDMKLIFNNLRGIGKLDYVTAWYEKTAEYIQDTYIKVAFVSTNSISQGEQVSILWKKLLMEYGIKIHFAYRQFKWQSKGRGMAAVFVVIIGFGCFDIRNKYIFDETQQKVKNINPYLVEGNDIIISPRRKAICDVIKMQFGSMPNDDGNLILTDDEKVSLIDNYPESIKFIKPLIIAKDYLHGINMWCLWLKNSNPKEWKAIPEIRQRVKSIAEKRLESNRDETRNLALTPYLFGEDRQPNSDYIYVPLTTSKNRRYVPLDILPKDYILNNTGSSVKTVDLYYFGVMSSIMHMTWLKYVGGRLKEDYRYAGTIVYNNFPWPENVKSKNVRRTKLKAQKIFEARSLYPDNTLADLYAPELMPVELIRAHLNLDKEVDKCYRSNPFTSERNRIEYLFKLYEKYLEEL